MKICVLSRNPATLQCLGSLQKGPGADQWQLWTAAPPALSALVDQERPNALLIEDDDLDSERLDALREIIARHPALGVILLSGRQTPEFLLRALRAGVREVMPLPVTPESLRQAIETLRQRLDAARLPRPQGRIMAWMASKGGAGATFLATNLGYALAAAGKRVCFIDLNLHFGEASLYVSEEKPEKTIADVLQQIQRMDGPLLESSMLHVAPNFWLLAAPDSPEAIGEIEPKGMERLLNVARANFDFVILDVSRRLDAESIRALDQADEIQLVVQMSLPFLRDATRLLRLFASLGYARERIHVVVNRFEKEGDISLKELGLTLGVASTRTVPNSFSSVAMSINQGRPILELAPASPVARKLQAMAHDLAAVEKPARGVFGRLLGRWLRPTPTPSPV